MSLEKTWCANHGEVLAGLSNSEASRDFDLGSPHQLFYRTVSRQSVAGITIHPKPEKFQSEEGDFGIEELRISS